MTFMHFFFIPLAKAVSVCYISAWRPEVSHISSASFVLQVPGKRRSSSAWEFSPFGQLWRQLFWDLPQLPTIDFFSICCLQTKGQLIVFSGSIFIWRDFHFFSFCSLLFNLFRKLHLLRAHVRGKKKNVNDFCSNWFQQKTRDPWHHVF